MIPLLTIMRYGVLALGLFLADITQARLLQSVYYGQTPGQNNLSYFCSPSQGIDIIPLAFLSQFGAPLQPGGSIADCDITLPLPPTLSPACAQLAKDIKYCQSQNKKVYLSLGGAAGPYGLSNQSDAETLAEQLWGMYGPVQKGYTGPRPLGDAVLDGFDLDIENNVGAYNYIFLIWKFRELFATDPHHKTYYISGAPQCPPPDASMGDMIFNSPFDQLFIQYYNTPTCSARGKISGYDPKNGRNQYFTFDAWRDVVTAGFSQSGQAEMLIGLPGSSDAADNDEPYYLQPKEALKLINEYRYHPGFTGVMLWDAGSSQMNVNNGCTYSQEIRKILDEGRTC